MQIYVISLGISKVLGKYKAILLIYQKFFYQLDFHYLCSDMANSNFIDYVSIP